jgi:ribonucleoside-diphosphate reductase alpha chain
MREIAEKGSLADIEGIPEDIKKVFVTAHDISPEWHVWMQAAFQKFTDNAVSKTVNFPQDATTEDIRKVYELAYRLGCKGVTVYRDKSREAQVLNIGKVNREEAEADIEEFEDVEEFEAIEGIEREEHEVVSSHTLKSPRSRADVTRGTTRKMKTGCGALYVTINEDKYGIFEIFAQMGKAGGCSASQNETTGRLISLALRSGIEVKTIIKQLSGIRCPQPIWTNGTQILSCSDAIAKALKQYIEEKNHQGGEVSFDEDQSVASILTCPDCGSAVVHESGCVTCTVCGFSKC